MKSHRASIHRHRSYAIKAGVTIFSSLLLSSLAIAQPSPKSSPSKAPEKSPSTTPEKTPNTRIDAKTEAELLQAEDRFITAILNGDAKALGELLHDHYADAFGESSSALTKRGVLNRVSEGHLPAYRILKERKLTLSVDLFTVEGLARAQRQVPDETSASGSPFNWFRVRRLWIKTGDRWVITAQIITPVEESETEKDAKEKAKD